MVEKTGKSMEEKGIPSMAPYLTAASLCELSRAWDQVFDHDVLVLELGG
jgi:hypothetical protein